MGIKMRAVFASFSAILLMLIMMSVISAPMSEFSDSCQAMTQLARFKLVIRFIIKAKLDRQQFISFNDNVTICEIDNDIIAPPHFPKGEPQKWVKVLKRHVYVFSAFYEMRELAHGPSIRVIACGWQEQFNVIGDLFCHLWYRNRNYAVTVKALYQRIYPSLAHADMWVSHFVICPLPKLSSGQKVPIPYAVQVVADPCVHKIQALMVLNRKPVAKKGRFALCTSPLYGHFQNWTMVAEMFELQTLLGAEEITIYQFSVHWHTEKLLESYLKDKHMKVNVIMWKSFPPLKSNVWCQRGALNDCLYRMGHKYEYVSITDLDEVLVPRMVPTWKQLMAHIAKPEYGAYLFQHAYFRRNYTEQSRQGLGLISQSSFWRTDVVTPPGKIRCKSMYQTSQAVSLDLHFPYLLVDGAKEYILDPKEGMLHHYRPYPMESFMKRPENYNFIEDRHMEMYKEKLTERMKPRMEDAMKRF